MSARHQSGPCALDHDSDLDVTTVHQVAGDHATVARLLGLDVHGGRVRVTAATWRTVVGLVVLLEDARNAASADLSASEGASGQCGRPGAVSEAPGGAEGVAA